jgi:hypothetical protein
VSFGQALPGAALSGVTAGLATAGATAGMKSLGALAGGPAGLIVGGLTFLGGLF